MKLLFAHIARILDDRLGALGRAAASPLFATVHSALIATMPLVFVGTFGLLVNSFPLPGYKAFMAATFGPEWTLFGRVLWSSTLAVISLTIQFSVGAHIAGRYSAANPLTPVSSLIAGLVSFASLLSLIIMGEGGPSTQWFDLSGLFVALLVAMASVRLFLFLFSRRCLRLYVGGGTPDVTAPETFSALVPGMLTVLVFALAGLGLHTGFEMGMHDVAYAVLRAPFALMDGALQNGLGYIAAVQGLSFMGIHGSGVLDPLTYQGFSAAQAANDAAVALGQPVPHIMTKSFMYVFVLMGGAGATLSLTLALIFFGGTPNQRRLAFLSLAPGLFNLNEVLLFGLPLILNPIMLIPFILTPLLAGTVSWAAIALGLVPGIRESVEWSTPIFLNAYLATGSIQAVLLQVVTLGLGVGVYAPFVILGNTLRARRAENAFRELTLRVGQPGEWAPGSFDRSDEAGLLARTLAADLAHDFQTGENLFLQYQPQVAADTGAVVGVEAFIRWRHSFYGIVPAPVTVALAEASGLISPLGLRIFEEACATRQTWLAAGVENCIMVVNISARQLEDGLLDAMVEVMRRHKVMPELMELEITESHVPGIRTAQSRLLAHLHALGVRIAIDNFGMGHGSLKYIKRFPVSGIKIDGSISREVAGNPICADIVASITRLCRGRRISCAAELVESEAQADALRALGVDVLQGKALAPLFSAGDCLEFIKETNANAAVNRRRRTA